MNEIKYNDEPLNDEIINQTRQIYTSSIFERLRQAKVESHNTQSLAGNIVLILFSSIIGIIIQISYLAVFIYSLVIGWKYRNECPLEEKIPLWLICTGIGGTIITTIKAFQNMDKYFSKAHFSQYECILYPSIVNLLLNAIIIGK